MALLHYGKLLAKINGELQREQCAITLSQACGQPDRITLKSAVPLTGLEFDAHRRIGQTVHIALHMNSERYGEIGAEVLAYDARIISAELESAVVKETCSTFTCEALAQSPAE